jgi:hypothetical protein
MRAGLALAATTLAARRQRIGGGEERKHLRLRSTQSVSDSTLPMGLSVWQTKRVGFQRTVLGQPGRRDDQAAVVSCWADHRCTSSFGISAHL